MHHKIQSLIANIGNVFFGKRQSIEFAIAALLARGHVLIEDAPGLGKTMLARALALSIDAEFRRIQFTPDMLPTDVTGVSIYHPKHERFDFVAGPIFGEVVLADEVNRTTPRTQAALLEAMEERQVTVEGRTTVLPDLFFVIATQNPVELEGTFPLPEAQIDRFIMKLRLGYPDADDEKRILRSQQIEHPIHSLEAVLGRDDVLAMQREAAAVEIGESIEDYIIAIARASREHADLRLGLSPRGTLALSRAARALSYVRGCSYVTPDVVQELAESVLGHRFIIDSHREYGGLQREDVVAQILASVPLPLSANRASQPPPPPASLALDANPVKSESVPGADLGARA